jgi:hypothetical protein
MKWFEDKLNEEMKGLYRKVKEDLRDRESSRCLDEETLVSYLENKLNATEVKAVEKHLSLCRECNEYVVIMNRINRFEGDENLPSPPEGALNRAIGLAAKKDKQPPVKAAPHLLKALVEWGTEFFRGFRSPSFSFSFATAAVLASLAVAIVFIKITGEERPPGNALPTISAKVVASRSPLKDSAYSFSGGDAADALSKKIVIQEKGELKPGDEFQLVLQLKREACIYVFAQSDEKRPFQLFPDTKSSQPKRIMPDTEYVIPAESQYFRVADETGEENIYIIATKRPFSDTTGIANLLRAGGIKEVETELGSIIISTKALSFVIVDDKGSNK